MKEFHVEQDLVASDQWLPIDPEKKKTKRSPWCDMLQTILLIQPPVAGQFEISGLFEGTDFDSMALPHSGQTPLVLPMRLYRQVGHSFDWRRRHSRKRFAHAMRKTSGAIAADPATTQRGTAAV
jgi:hypothetical protein